MNVPSAMEGLSVRGLPRDTPCSVNVANLIDAIALDWNGTVVDDRDRALRSTNQVLADLGRPAVDMDAFRAAFTLPLGEFFLNLGIGPALHSNAIEHWNRGMRAEPAGPQRGAERLLAWAHRSEVPVVVVSGAARESVVFDVSNLGFADLITSVYAPVHDKARQLRKLRTSIGDRIVYVGDTVADIVAAQDAGVRGVAFAEGYHDEHALRSAAPDDVVSDLSDIADLVCGRR